MAPTVEEIDDESVLEKMLEQATVFEERKRIRARLRELRKLKKDPSGTTITPNPERKRTRDPGLSVTTKVGTAEPSTALSPVSPATKTQRVVSPGGTTAAETSIVEEEDGGTKTQTTTTVTTGPSSKRVEVTTLSKSNDGAGGKSASIKQEVTSEKVEKTPTGSSSVSVSKTVSTSSSSSSSSSSTPLVKGRPQTKFQKDLEEKKKAREDKRKEDEAKWKETLAQKKTTQVMVKKQHAMDQKNKKTALMDKFGGKASSMGPSGGGGGGGGGTRIVVQNANTIKQKLLDWAKHCTRNYPNVKVDNFSSSWCDGMAFCALVHYYFPEAYDFSELDPKNRKHNFDLAFDTADKLADCMPLLETEDMLMMKNKPDWKCVFTYVQSLYRGLHKATGQAPPQ